MTRKMLIAGRSSSYGGVANSAVTKLPQAVSKSPCCAAVKPSASRTMLKARLSGASPEIWVRPSTVPSEVVMVARSLLWLKGEVGKLGDGRLTEGGCGRPGPK